MQLALGYAILGALIATGQAPLNLWWASLGGLTALFWVLPGQAGPGGWGGRLWATGTGYFATALFWIIEPFLVEPEIHGWMAPFALILMAGGLGLFWALAGWAAARLDTMPARIAALGVVLLLLELARGWVFTGFPWAMLGHALIATPLVHLATLGGAGGLGLVLVLAALLPRIQPDTPRRIASLVAVVILLAGGWVWGRAQTSVPPDRDQIIRLVQPNAPQDEKWREDRMLFFFDRLLDLSAAPPATPDAAPDLILWPETAVPFFLEFPGDGLEMMADAAAAHGPDTKLGFGVQRYEDGRFFNALAMLDTQARITHVYDKHHLVPFGEYVPFSEAILGTGLAGFAAQALAGYSPGPGPVVLDMGPLGRVAPMICYETIFARYLRLPERPDWVLQITNDAWFGELTGPFQHLAQAQLRAVEQGLPVLRAANTGVSAAIDARGRIIAQLDLGEAGFVDMRLPGALPPTIYARLGEWPLWALLLVALGGILWRDRARRPA